MSDKAIISREEDGEDWFTELCRDQGLEPQDRKEARDIVVGDVLFEVFGQAWTVGAVETLRGGNVQLKDDTGRIRAIWAGTTGVSLIARKAG